MRRAIEIVCVMTMQQRFEIYVGKDFWIPALTERELYNTCEKLQINLKKKYSLDAKELFQFLFNEIKSLGAKGFSL